MALSDRPQHAAPGPLLALYMDFLNGLSGLRVAQHVNLWSVPPMALSVRSLHMTCSTVWEILKWPVWASHDIACETQARDPEDP